MPPRSATQSPKRKRRVPIQSPKRQRGVAEKASDLNKRRINPSLALGALCVTLWALFRVAGAGESGQWSLLRRGQRLVDVGQDIVDILKADGQTDVLGHHAGDGLLLDRQL